MTLDSVSKGKSLKKQCMLARSMLSHVSSAATALVLSSVLCGCAKTAPPPVVTRECPAASVAASVSVIPYDIPNANQMAAPPPLPPSRLPGAEVSEPMTPVFAVAVTMDQTIMVDGRALKSLDELGPLASAAHTQNPDVRAVIMADQDVKYGAVVRVMDILKQAKIAKIAFAVQAPPPSH